MKFSEQLKSGVILDNPVFMQTIGLCPTLATTTSLQNAIGMGAAVTFVIFGASILTYGLYKLVLEPNSLEYMDLLSFILIIASFVQFVEMFLKKTSPSLYEALGVYLPLITTNCAVLGIALTNVQNYNTAAGLNIGQKLLDSVVSGLGTAVGFTIAIIIMAGIRERNEFNDVPESFKGMPIVLLTAGLMAIAFFGFSGII